MRPIFPFLAALLCFFAQPVFAQDNFLKNYAPVAPTPASLGKYGDIPVGYHTGTPDISIPVHTLTEGAVSVSVGLSYHSSGIRVQETASWVGLGWALNAGGVITRTVQGAPDEGGNVSQYWAWYNNGGSGMASNLCPPFTAVATGVYDTEPDIFNFNVGGYAGKFFYDKTQKIHVVPQQDITIETINLSGQVFSGWILTDPQGTRYHFGATSAGMTMSDYVEKSESVSDPFTPINNNSSWYLSKIESADRKDVISFSYVEEKYSFWDVSSAPVDGGIINTSNPGTCVGGVINAPMQTKVIGKRLTAITGSNGSIAFTGDDVVRQDLSNYNYCTSSSCTPNLEAKALKTIQIRDKASACLRQFDFSYTYSALAPVGSFPSGQLPYNTDETDRKRLILTSLVERECATTTNSKTHAFEYYDQNALPRRISYAQDHWGYYNAKTSNTDLTPGYKYTQTLCNNCQGNYTHLCTVPPDNREPAFPAMRNGTLKKITYPTGGSSTFDYEAHTTWSTDTTCTEAEIEYWTASTGSCTNGAFNTRTYTFTAPQMSNGHIKLEWSNPFCSTSGSVTMLVYAGPSATGTPIASINTGGLLYSLLSNVGGVTLNASTQYTFKIITSNGVGAARFYTLTRVGVPANKMVGGLRIKTITTDDGDATTSNNIVKNFEYYGTPTQSSGKLVYKPLYRGFYKVKCIGWGTPPGCTDTCSYDLNNENTYPSCPAPNVQQPLHVVYASTGLQPMQTTQGSHIGYTTVRTSETGNGTSIFYYDMGQYNSGPWVPTGFPFPPPPYDPMLGTQTAEEHYSNTGSLIFTKQYQYLTATVNAISGYDAMKLHYVNNQPNGIRANSGVRFYNITTGYSLPNKVTERQYNSDGLTYVEKVTDIGYMTANGHYQKTTEDVTDSDGTVYRSKYKYVKDYPCPVSGACDETNTTADAEGKAIYAMRKRNMVALPIEQTTWVKRPSWGSFRLSGATYFQFDKVNTDYNNIKIQFIHQVRPMAPATDFIESTTSTSGDFTKHDAKYTQEYNFNFSDTHGKLLSQWKQNDPAKQQYIWGHNQKIPTAKIINAEVNEVAFTSFEEQQVTPAANGNWTLNTASGWSTTTGNFYTGRTGYNISNTTRNATINNLPVGTYVVSGWYRDGQIKVNGTPIGTVAGAIWTYAETTLSLGAGSSVVITGSLVGTHIDELRLCPADALMRTFSFDDRNQLLLSVADENSVPAHYDYDTWQRLQSVRDQDRNILQTYEYNYRPGGGVLNDVKARTVLTTGQTTTAMVNALTGSNVRQVFRYMDGLGRPVQTNGVSQSPTSKDIITYNLYDQYGRETKKYIPYTIATNGGVYRTGAATEQNTFANTFGASNYGYSETRFEPSPLNRPVEQAAPGAPWIIGAATIKYAYRGNFNNTSETVRNFTGSAFFATDAVFVTEETDENLKKNFTYTDKLGRTILIKQQINSTVSNPPTVDDYALTYTIYDDFGRVAAVIPPETTKKMINTSNWLYTSGAYTNCIFRYNYDSRGRLTSKTVPSGGTTSIDYDRLDRPVLSADAKGFKTFTRYDILGRPVVTGKYKGSASPGGSDPLYETSNTTAPHYYSSTAFPTDNNLDVYKVLYYDDYDLDNNGSLGAGETYTNPSETDYDAAAFLRTRSKPTASKVGILKNDGTAPVTFLTTRTYYDKEYSVIQVNKQNHLSGADITSSAYDFANRVTKTRRDHTATPPGGSAQSHTIREEYVYDHASRLRFTRHKINANSWVVINAPVYDELSRMRSKRLHAYNYDGSSPVTLLSGFAYLQNLDYTYNIRGWLTGINDPSSCTLQEGDNLIDMFSMKLTYETNADGGTAQFNGNIATMQWRTYIDATCLELQQYRFNYDGANRLTAADHRTWNGSAWTTPSPLRYSESGITYDLNGNLKSYTRNGLVSGTSTFGIIDQLTYTYGDASRPDRLTQVSESPTSSYTKGFRYTPSAASYQYDSNGNMTQDNHKSLTIGYNFLNLPQLFTVTGSGAGTLTMTYTADGEKLTKVPSAGATQNYVSGIEYSGANLEAIYTSDGRCKPNGASAFFYEY